MPDDKNWLVSLGFQAPTTPPRTKADQKAVEEDQRTEQEKIEQRARDEAARVEANNLRLQEQHVMESNAMHDGNTAAERAKHALMIGKPLQDGDIR
jgi:hypothetical protein